MNLKRLEQLGIITKVDQPTDWISSLVINQTQSGKLRVCIDPKEKPLPFNGYGRSSTQPMQGKALHTL